jgi:sporulation protein YlmC with PRC-barrel domain
MRLSDLEGKVVRRQNGETLGTVYEVRLHRGRVASLICGRKGFGSA